jgi:APA family basic amino acid/polyamine antiporter
MAAGLVIVLSIMLVFGVKETFWLNSASVIISVATILVTIIAGATKVDPANFTKGGFFPYGFSGCFTATSSVFFAYIGFDQITQSAEEAANPKVRQPTTQAHPAALCST